MNTRFAFKQVRDVLEEACACHTRLREHLRELKLDNADPGLDRLLAYAEQGELRLEQAIERFEDWGRSGLLETWFKYAPSADLREGLGEVADKLTVTAVAVHIAMLDERLAAFFTEMAARSQTAQVRELFEDLARMEHRQSVQALLAGNDR